jgi:hypothetical protein
VSKSKILKRCDNCHFSSWMLGPARPALTCKEQAGFASTRRMVLLDASCANFLPSELAKLGPKAIRPIPLTRGKFAIVDADDYYQLSKFRWSAIPGGKTFYAAGSHGGKRIQMHRMIMDAPGHLVVDHIDHNGLNNCRSNLRLCTAAQNCCNKSIYICGASKYKGVYWYKDRKKWSAKIKFNHKLYNLGYFADEITAAKAYDEKAKELHGEFACLNFPPEVISCADKAAARIP